MVYLKDEMYLGNTMAYRIINFQKYSSIDKTYLLNHSVATAGQNPY